MRYQFATVELRRRGPIKTTDDIVSMCVKEGLFTSAQEVFHIICFDGETQLRSVVEIGRGDYHSVPAPIPVILSALAASGADRFWLMHNHPDGNVKPTKIDLDLTRQIMVVANLSEHFLEDHLIIGPPDKIYSMAQHGQITPHPRITGMIAAQDGE